MFGFLPLRRRVIFVFFLLLMFFICLSLLLTLYVNEQNSRTETLAQQVAILDHHVRKLRASKSNSADRPAG